MSANLPVTIWEPPQKGEFTQSGNPNLCTEASVDLLTEAGVNIILEDDTFSPFQSTVWTENDGI